MPPAAFSRVRYETEGPIARVTINRPERMNAIDHQTSRELFEAFNDFRHRDDLRVAILTGAGDRAFSAGADLVARAEGEGRDIFGEIPFGGIPKAAPIYKPIIAAINGYCLAGGLEIALACDVRIAVPEAKFGLTEVRWGIIPGAGGTQRLPRSIPLALASEMIFSAEPIDAETALRAGLISRIVPAADLPSTATAIANTIAARAPLAVRASKEAMLRGLDMSLADGLAFEDHLAERIYLTKDAKEGPRAFAEKRPPNFQSR